MEKIAVFVNDSAYALHVLQPMLQGARPTHWVLVACPPALSRHIGRWVSHSARQQWRERRAAEIFSALQGGLSAAAGSRIETLVAARPLVELSAQLQSRLPDVRLLDARRIPLGRAEEPVTLEQPAADGARWVGPVAAATGLTALLTLAD